MKLLEFQTDRRAKKVNVDLVKCNLLNADKHKKDSYRIGEINQFYEEHSSFHPGACQI